MASIMESKDLCTACNYSTDCIQRVTLQRPVWFCEEFDSYMPAPQRTNKTVATRTEASDYHNYSGICMNCENRYDCLRPKPEGGIWQCEEYR